MRRTSFILTALSVLLAGSAGAQSDQRSVYGSPSFAIPGSSAVGYASPVMAKAAAPTASFIGAPTTESTQIIAKAGDTSAEGLTKNVSTDGARSDTPCDTTTTDYPMPPFSAYRYGDLHQGLNVSLDLSVFAAFGKHARSGAGFSQSLTATYLHPLGKKAWMAVGGYVDHTNWSGLNYTSGGLYGELGYQFNDHWSAYIYGRKAITTSGGVRAYGYPAGRGLYDLSAPYMYNNLGDKLGAAVRWKPNPTFTLEVSVEKNWYPTGSYGYADKYNYPIPKD